MSASVWIGGIARLQTPLRIPLLEAPAARHDRRSEGGSCTRPSIPAATCHGVNGRSVAPTFPNLAAQTAPYIELQLHAFKDQSRADPDAQAYMWGMASQLSDATITGLANYFAAQPAAVGEQATPHSSRKERAIRRRRAGAANSSLRNLPRPPCPRHGDLSAPRRSTCAVLTQATAGDPKCVAHGSGDARSRERSEQGSDASGSCLS